MRLHWVNKPTDTWTLPADRHHHFLTMQGDATITPDGVDSITATPTHAAHMPPQESSAPTTVCPGPTPWQAIVITYPASNNHTHTWQHRWEEVRGDLLQEHVGLTRTHHTMWPVRAIVQARHGVHTPG